MIHQWFQEFQLKFGKQNKLKNVQSDVQCVNFANAPCVLLEIFSATFWRDGDFFPFQRLPKNKGTFKGLR